MSRPESPAAPGRLEAVSRTEEEGSAAARIALEAWSRGPVHGAFVDLCGARAYFKQSALTGKTRLRYAVRRAVLHGPLPRLREYGNLLWLRERGFHAPEPIAAGAVWRGGLPLFQYLFTREVEGARTAASFLEEEKDRARRDAWVTELAGEVARMHALGFVHHDLFPRNVLVAPGTDRRTRSWFLDCWAGGPAHRLRGPAYDLACFTLEGERHLSSEERVRLLEEYAAARARRGRPIRAERFSRRIAVNRDALAARLHVDRDRA